jgi:hypothetical protein
MSLNSFQQSRQVSSRPETPEATAENGTKVTFRRAIFLARQGPITQSPLD